MQSHANDGDQAALDLGPLAWVLDELRKSLDTASAALRRFVRDAGLARGADIAVVDDAQLRIARQQLHQAVGALEMVGLPAPARLLRSMEAAVQKFTERPDLCGEAAAAKIERAGFALTQYLASVLAGKPGSPVALFSQYRDTQEVAGSDRIHPADLWVIDFRWTEPEVPAADEALGYEPALRSRMDQAVLRVVRSGDPRAARELSRLCLGLAAGATERQPRVFWKIGAAFFEALALELLPLDVYLKRTASRVLMQYAPLAKGDSAVSDRLAQDLLFFCAQALPQDATQAPVLAGVRRAWGLSAAAPVDYQTAHYGRVDPLLQAQARKRLAAAKESWSSVAGGDANKLRGLVEQFHALGESLQKLNPESEPLARALLAAVETVARADQPPGPELAMEVATAMLYLEAGFEEAGPADVQMAQRTARLGERLDRVRGGGKSEPLEPWIEELYGRVSDRQTMGSVVGELRGTLGELEKLLDAFFRHPADKVPLQAVPGQLSQMRGVLSVLGLEQAAQAVLRMREGVELILAGDEDASPEGAAGTVDRLGNNLGALGFLIDMLSYQPVLAKKLFVYDDALGELRPLMGRSAAAQPQVAPPAAVPSFAFAAQSVLTQAHQGNATDALSARLDMLAMQAILADQAGIAQTAREASAAVAASDGLAVSEALNTLAEAVQAAGPVAPPAAPAAEDFEEDDLQGIFLEEAREVVSTGQAALAALALDPRDAGELTTLRRAFHTLKGSSRMVGLTEFGDAGWSMEQVLNTWLADHKAANEDLRTLCSDALRAFGLWVEDIASHRDGAWKAEAFRQPADALRLEQRLIPVLLPTAGAAPVGAPAPVGIPEASLAGLEAPLAVPEAPLAVPEAPVAGPEAPLAAVPEVAPEPVLAPAVLPAAAAAEEAPAPQETAPAVASEDTVSAPVEASPDAPGAPANPAPLSDGDIDIDVDIDFDFDLADDPAFAPALAAPSEEGPGEADAGVDIELLDFSAFEPTPLAPAAAEMAVFDEMPADAPALAHAAPLEEPAASLEAPAFADVHVEAAAPAQVQEEAPAATGLEPEPVDEQVRVIGDLRIGIPLYNVYLNEADELSRRLLTEVSEWSLELNQPVPDSTVGLAHALAGASATVGFHALSEVARALEDALAHTQGLAAGTEHHGRTFTGAAEEIRRLLHQFAAGFLKAADPAVMPALLALTQLAGAERADGAPAPALVADEPAAQAGAPVEAAAAPAQAAASAMAEAPAAAEAAAPADAPAASADAPADAPVAAPTATAPPTPTAVPALEAPPAGTDQVRAVSLAAVPLAVRTVTARDAEEGEEQLDAVDAVDFELFPIFEEEAAELMPQLGGALRQWVARPENRSARDEVLRALHTLKGSARLAGALRLGELAHRLESEIEQIGVSAAAAAEVEPLLVRYDRLQANFERLRATGGHPASKNLDAHAEATQPVSLPVALERTETDPALQAPPVQEVPPAAAPATGVRALALPAALLLAPQRAAASHAVRVRSQLLDRLVNQAGEVMITRSRLEAELGQLRSSLGDLTGNLDRLRTQLRDIELQAESQMQSRLAQSKDVGVNFDPLEFDRFTRVQELTRMMAESVNDIATVQRNLQRTVEATQDGLIAQARQTRELQRDLLRTRMVEFEGISDRLYRVVRLASKETGKQVRLDISGGSIEMDRGVLDRMTPAFEHLLRNCVAHGIEAPAARAAAGKEPIGTILIGLSHEGNDVSVEFRDDGAGLDLDRIREKALQRGLTPPGRVLDDAATANLIFLPGFSTASEVTELAGRGIGMDVVRSEVNALGGRIETHTAAGQGTRFKLVLPLTTAVTQVVMIRSGNLSIGVPANVVETVLRVPAEAVAQAYASGFYQVGGEELPFYWSGALLQASQRSSEPPARALTLVVFRSAAQRIAVHVDQVLGNQEAVVKNLGPQLARLPGLAGMTVLASGAVVLIYNPVALTAVYGEQARRLGASGAQDAAAGAGGIADAGIPVSAAVAQVPLVLVVDDSITVRRVTQRLLQREGYRVAMAADGLQALARLAEEKPAVVLSDIEMPRMDGFDLARNIRADQRLADLPIIMITSRIAAKHREHAMTLGVNHYLGKPYSDEELLSLVRHYCSSAIAA